MQSIDLEKSHNLSTPTRAEYRSRFPIRLEALRWFGRQTWIPRGRDRILRMALSPETCQPYSFEVDFFGLRYRGDLSQYIDWLVFMYGSYAYWELSLLEAISEELRKAQSTVNFFDVGANVGHHTLFMARLADRVLAFEPFGDLRDLIAQKISINGLTNVEVLPFALGAKDEELPYYPAAGRNSGMGTLMQEHGPGFRDPINVVVRKGDSLFDEYGLPRVDILKVDVQGFEPLVFQGLSRRIRCDRPIILTEITDESRQNAGSEEAFSNLFYEGAVFAEVHGRPGCKFNLKRFDYATAYEVLIVPPERTDFVSRSLAL